MNTLSNFSIRLKELLEEKELNPPMLAQIVNTDRTNITRYLRGERLPSFETFINLINYFECSADFILGLTEHEEIRFKPCPLFSERFQFLLQYYKISKYKLSRDCKIPESVVYRWRDGKCFPTVENLVKLAKYFDCTVDFILGRES